MSDVVGIAVLLSVLVVALFITNLLVFRSLFLSQQEAIGDWQDALSKIAQIGFIHAKSRTPEQAVAVQAQLEAEQKAMDEAPVAKEPPEPKRKVVGFRGPNGEVIHFSRGTRPTAEVLAKIPKDKLVYQ